MINLNKIANKMICNYLHVSSTEIPKITYNERGDREHKINGLLHREDGPAVEYESGSKSWYLNGHYIRYDPETWDQLVKESHIEKVMED